MSGVCLVDVWNGDPLVHSVQAFQGARLRTMEPGLPILDLYYIVALIQDETSGCIRLALSAK